MEQTVQVDKIYDRAFYGDSMENFCGAFERSVVMLMTTVTDNSSFRFGTFEFGAVFLVIVAMPGWPIVPSGMEHIIRLSPTNLMTKVLEIC